MPGSVKKFEWRRYFLSIMLFCSVIASGAQEMQSVGVAKYSGINGISLNPSLPVLSPLYLDINLVSTNVFVQNNYLYIFSNEDKLSRLIKNDVRTLNSSNKFYSDKYTPGLKHGLVDVSVMGPSVALMFGRHSVGLYTGLRSVTSFKQLPYTLAKFFYEGLYFPPQYDMTFNYPDKITFGSMHWGEIGLNYSGIIFQEYDQTVSIGLTIKQLLGYAGSYVTMEHLSYRVPNYDTLIVYNTDMEAGLSAPLDYNGNSFNSSLIRGKGTGLDFGITYEKKVQNGKTNTHVSKLCAQSYTPYLFRIGAAVTDLGSIRFTSNSMKLKVSDGSLFWPGISGLQFGNVNTMTAELSNRFFGDPQKLIVDDKFSMSLPATINLHADVNLTGIILNNTNSSLTYNMNKRQVNRFLGHGEWFVSGVVIMPLTTRHTTISTSSVISAATRYETRYFQAGISANLWNYDTFMMGANLRIGYFFIGTDDLLSYMKIKDYTGTNIYAGVKFNLAKGSCKSSGFSCPDIF